MPKPKSDSPGSSLEPLVRYPKGADSRVVTVSGVFRGAEPVRGPAARKPPRRVGLGAAGRAVLDLGDRQGAAGKGWSLDPRSRADCRFRIEATGKVAIANGYIYLRATSLQLLGRAKEE